MKTLKIFLSETRRIELSDLIGFGYDLSDTQVGLKCWKCDLYFVVNMILSAWQGFK